MSGNLSELGFDVEQVDPNQAFDVLPPGDYDVVIVASERKKTRSGDGEYIKLELQIANGEFQNRKLWDNLNIHNPNATAQQIARANLSAICRAVGVLKPEDTKELHFKPLRIKVTIRKDQDGNNQNQVKSYKPRQAGPPQTNGASQASAPATAVVARPWA